MRRINIWRLAVILGLALFTGSTGASAEGMTATVGAMRIWRSADGLPSDSVTAIIQSRDGFLWVGTTAGLVWFDGVKFTQVPLPVLSGEKTVHVTALCEDARGRLWIGTQRSGLFRLEHGEIHCFTVADGLLDNNVTSLAADTKGQVWIGSKSGLNLWTGKAFRSFTTRDGLSDEYVSGVNVARSGTVWITTRTGMCRFIGGRIVPYAFKTESQGRSPQYLGAYEDRRGNLWAFGDTYLINLAEGKRFNYFRSSESASVRIWSLCEGRDGRLWIGTSGRGLFCFEDNRFEPVILGQNRWPYDVRAIYEDHEGNLWLGTSGGGLVQLRPQSVHVLRAGQGLPSSPPSTLAVNANGRIYVGLQRGGLFAGEAGRFDRVAGSDGQALQGYVSSVCVTKDGTVWAGTLGDGLYGTRNGRVLQFTTADGLADNFVLTVCPDATDGVWVSTSAGTVSHFNGRKWIRYGSRQGLPGSMVTAMIKSASGGHWLGTRDGRIFREQNGTFTETQLTPKAGHHPILALHEDDQGRLWIGTDGGGLIALANGAELDWNASNGLPNNVVSGVVQDKSRNLWLATGAGICRINRSDLRKSVADPRVSLACRMISEVKTEPASPTYFGGVRAALSPDGELWFATSEGVLNVDTHQSEIEPTTFPVYIESVAFNGQPAISVFRGGLWSAPVTNKTAFRAPVDLKSLEIRFTALNYSTPGEVHFRHKLEGWDADWVDVGATRTARYPHLPYGHYRFRVAARIADGPWQESPQTFSFVVPTPLYAQKWAITLYVIIAIALIAGIVRMVSHRRLRGALAQLEQQQALERERMRIARDMHDEMGSKLTKISFLSEHAQVDPKLAGPLNGKIQAIARTSRELLQKMDEIVWVVNPRNDTLENLVAYLSHYAVEYFQNTRIQCELRLSPDMPHHSLSSEARHNLFLTFEEALNNVLKHSGATKVKVEMIVRLPLFEIQISDNGKGFEATAAPAPVSASRSGRGGNGLRNMRQRLMETGGVCEISSRPGEGTVVCLRMRLK